MTGWAGDDTDLPSNSHISKTVLVKGTFTFYERKFKKFSKDTQINRLFSGGSVVFLFKVYGNSGIMEYLKNQTFQFFPDWKA